VFKRHHGKQAARKHQQELTAWQQDQEQARLLTEDVRGCRATAEALEALRHGGSTPAEELLAVEQAQRQIEREREQEAIWETAHRHGWCAP
jgi:Mg-chelatase subunit ChlD